MSAAQPLFVVEADGAEKERALPGDAALSIVVTHDISAVETAWRALEADGIESPAQGFDFVSLWVDHFRVPQEAQFYVAAFLGGRPLALLALMRRRKWGVRVLEPFGGCHVGCHPPLADIGRLSAMSADERGRIWAEIARSLPGADVVTLPDVPDEIGGRQAPFAELGVSVESDTLYRAQFESWAECEAAQHTRTRRKHDRQQGAKLEAMGTIAFEELGSDAAYAEAVDLMFAQKAERFAELGIADPFEGSGVQAFYKKIFGAGVTLKGLAHVLRLDGRIVAVRYNLVHGDRMFCLVSSMDPDPALQPGSPGKQVLLRMMQRIFGQGYRVFDMGSGYSDEKRHWCNVQIPLRHRYLPLTATGRLYAAALGVRKRLKAYLKSRPEYFNALKKLRARLGRPG